MNKRAKEISKPSSKAIGKMIRISPYKLNLEAKSIRGKKVGDALSYLEFSKKRISNTVKNILESAIANAENNHALDIDKLYVDEAFVGKNMVMKRFRARARGRAAKILKPFSQLTIVLKEQNIEETK
jgi:ribosomal protein L22, bacterial type|tara:strand:+ start:1131 stop:1511 length:381 start_codon:yes stop_codon:yes gene_type:complete